MPNFIKLEKPHVAIVKKYIEAIKDKWSSEKTYQSTYYAIHQFLRWLDSQGLREENLTRELLEEFTRCPAHHEAGRTHQKNCRNKIRRYLAWRQSLGKISIPAAELIPSRRIVSPLPNLGQEFMEDRSHVGKKTFKAYRSAIGQFHQWLDAQKISIEDVNESQLFSFDERLRDKKTGHSHREKCNQRLRTYLSWLHKREILKLNNPKSCITIRKLGTRFHFELPEETAPFLEFAGVNLRKNTVANYRAALEHLYSFMAQEELKIAELKRCHFEKWLQHLKARGLGPTWRKSIIICARYYLFWLGEHDQITGDVDALLRLSDLPKIPQYLPKPLQPKDDLSLQANLARSTDVYRKALLLIRLTGLRIGEAVALPMDCLSQNHAGHRYLKVPLGKLDKERMVPVDERVFELVTWQMERTRTINGDSFMGNLMVQESGTALSKCNLRLTLHSVCRESEILEWVNVHRLRHTYATALLNGGMSLLGLMKVLGHHSMRMTLRYAAVSPETVREEYLAAISKIEQRHDLRSIVEKLRTEDGDPDISASFTELKTLVRRLGFEKDVEQNRMRLLIKRIQRLQGEIEQLLI